MNLKQPRTFLVGPYIWINSVHVQLIGLVICGHTAGEKVMVL
jgi:hypothetical protein